MFNGMTAGVALLLLSGFAQAAPVCTPPPDLQAELARRPNAQAYSALGYWYIEQKKLACAISAFRAAIRLDPSSFESRYNLGVALGEAGDPAGSAEQLRAAIRLNPDDANARSALAQVEQSLAAAAARHFQESSRLIGAGRREAAIAELLAAVRLRPDFAEALGNLGVLHQQQGKTAEAEKFFRRAAEANPRDAKHALNLGLTLADEKRYTEAIQAVDKALQMAPSNPAALTAKGMILLRQQQREEAIELFRRVRSADPKSPQAHVNLGIALAEAERHSEALQCFDDALRLTPGFTAAQFNRGRALYDLKRYEESRAALEEARRQTPGDLQIAYRLGLAEARLGEPAKAAELLEKVARAEPKNDVAHQELGQALIETGRPAEGEAHLRTALKLNPNNSQAAYALLKLLSARGSEEASQLGQRVRELKKEELSVTQARALSNFGLDAAKEKQWPKAVENLRKAVETCGNCAIQAALRRNLGLILAQSGDKAGAVAELQAAAKLNPADRDVQYALEVLTRMKAKP
jgi:tetratricopeptide (TPR) repeat protein